MTRKTNKKMKKRKRRIKKVENLHDVYKIINKVQLNEKQQRFDVRDFSLIPIIENLLKDTLLTYSIKWFKTKVTFTINIGEQHFNQGVDLENLEIEGLEELFDD